MICRFWIFHLVLFSFGGSVLADSALQDALSAIDKGDYAAAERALSKDPSLLLLHGILQFHRGDYVSAGQSLAKALNDREDSRGRVFLALTRATLGGCDAAEPELERQFQMQTSGEFQRLAGLALSQCHLGRGRYPEAFGVLAQLNKSFPADADVLYQTARFHMKAWNDAVFQMFEKTPASFRVNQLSAEIFEIQGKYSEAIAEYRKSIEKNPKALNLHFRLGRALLMESHSAEALERARHEFEAELQLNPNDAAAEYQVGQVLVAQQQPAAAALRYERAVELSPQFPEALLALGKIRSEQKRYDESIRLLRRAAGLIPTSEAVHYALMIAYRNAGRTAEAMQAKETLEKLQRPPEGEFTDFLRRLGETPEKSKPDPSSPNPPK